jgi:outer membrane receptor protein involved in Fe transport
VITIHALCRSINAILTAGVASALIVPMASAQEEERTRPVGDERAPLAQIDTVTVTGTRLKRDEVDLTQPTAIVDGEYLAQRGITNAQAALNSIPAVFRTADPIIASNTAANTQGVGQRTLNLFDLGSQRTLTLVDGMRFVSGNSPVGGPGDAGVQVDVNNIPVSLIERIEVVKVGGAAVYGSDAVAGVVNYVLRSDYEGAELAVDYSSFGSSIADEVSIRGLLGGNFSGGRGNLVLSGEYNETETVLSRDVPSLRDSWTLQQPTAADQVLGPDGLPVVGQLRLYPQPRAGILSFSGLLTPGPVAVTNVNLGIWPDGNFYQLDPAGTGNLVPYDRGTPTGNAVWSSGGDGLDLVHTNTAQEGADRYNITGLLRYSLTDSIDLKASVFSNRMSAANPGYQATRYSSGAFGSTSQALQFSTDHPFLPAASRATLEGLLGGPGVFYLHRGWLVFGAREIVNDASVNLYRAGLEGEFELAGKEWTWNVTGQKGWHSIVSETTQVNDNRWFASMDVGINPETGEIDCRYNYDPTVGENYVVQGFGIVSAENILGDRGQCVPFNPFGVASPEAVAYVTYNNIGQTRIEQDLAVAYVSGSLFELPAGPAQLALGYEYRREFAAFIDDGTTKLAGFPDSSLSGGYNTNDFFAETVIPLLSPDIGIPGLYEVGIEASFRSMDNSRAGRDRAWAAGLSYRPFESVFGDLMFRANIAETVRAPAVTELFLPVVASSQFAQDPCHGANLNSGPNPAVRRANCAAEGIPTDFVSLATNASRRGFTGGNINLENEQAESMNIGLAYSPSFVPGELTLAVDYTEIEINDAIVSFTLTNIMEACYDATNYPNEFCNMFVRDPVTHQLPAINAFTSGYVNAALRDFAAYEYTIRYAFDTERLGSFDILTRLYQLDRNVTSNTGFDHTDTTGQYDNPEWRGNLTIRHDIEKFSTFLDVFYWGHGERDVENTEPLKYIDNNGNPYTSLPSYMTVSLGTTYALTDNIELRAQIQNLTDWEPDNKEAQAGRWTWGQVYSLGMHMRF